LKGYKIVKKFDVRVHRPLALELLLHIGQFELFLLENATIIPRRDAPWISKPPKKRRKKIVREEL
jgi:hypothetical protein